MRRRWFGTFAVILSILPLSAVGSVSATFPGANAEIAFSAEGDIWLVDANGSDLHRLVASSLTERHPAWSPDGNTLAFTRIRGNGNADIYLADADGSDVRPFIRSRSDELQPAWSPSGDALVFVRSFTFDGRRGTDLVTRSLDGQDHHRITHNRTLEAAPAWTEDYIAWVSGRRREVCGSPLRRMNDDIRVCQVLGYAYRRTSLSFDPGSRRLAFGSRTDIDSDPFDIVVARFGQDDVNLTKTDGYRIDHSPAWSPDRTSIAFVGQQGDGVVLAVMTAAGTDIQEIVTTADVADINWPAWRSVP